MKINKKDILKNFWATKNDSWIKWLASLWNDWENFMLMLFSSQCWFSIFHSQFITFFLTSSYKFYKLELMFTYYLHFLLGSICTWFFFFESLYLFQVICNLKWTRIILHGFFCKHPIQVAGNFICDLNKGRGGFLNPGKKDNLVLFDVKQTDIYNHLIFIYLTWFGTIKPMYYLFGNFEMRNN